MDFKRVSVNVYGAYLWGKVRLFPSKPIVDQLIQFNISFLGISSHEAHKRGRGSCQNHNGGARESSVAKLLALQACGPEFHLHNMCENQGPCYRQALGEMGAGGSMEVDSMSPRGGFLVSSRSASFPFSKHKAKAHKE